MGAGLESLAIIVFVVLLGAAMVAVGVVAITLNVILEQVMHRMTARFKTLPRRFR